MLPPKRGGSVYQIRAGGWTFQLYSSRYQRVGRDLAIVVELGCGSDCLTGFWSASALGLGCSTRYSIRLSGAGSQVDSPLAQGRVRLVSRLRAI
jgi:hypothetical protein